jgi:hypothetical protein
MSDAQAESRAEWKGRLVALLRPHLKDGEDERSSAIAAVLMTLEAAHNQGMREAASFCRQVGTAAHRHGEVARALAEGIEALAKKATAEAAAAARQRQADP